MCYGKKIRILRYDTLVPEASPARAATVVIVLCSWERSGEYRQERSSLMKLLYVLKMRICLLTCSSPQGPLLPQEKHGRRLESIKAHRGIMGTISLLNQSRRAIF
jgi:hypothetical protein